TISTWCNREKRLKYFIKLPIRTLLYVGEYVMGKSFKIILLIILLIIATTAAVFGYSGASNVDTVSLVNSNVFKVVSAESKGGHATAFAITQGYLVTANHVCEIFRSKEYMKIEGLGFKKILATDLYNDLCILEGDKKVKGLKLTTEYKEFEAVFSINFQGEYAVKSLHYGNVSQKKILDDLLFKIETQEQFEKCLVRGRVVSNNVVALCLGEFE